MNTAAKTPWTPETIEKKIIQIIAEKVDFPPEKVRPEMAFVTDIPVDSLELVEIGMDVEDAFNIKTPEDNKSFRTVGDLIRFVQEQKRGET